MSKLLIQNGKLLRGAGGKLLTTDSAQAMRDCCCGTPGPCACDPLYLYGPWSWGRILLLPEAELPDDPGYDCCAAHHVEDWTEQGGIYADIFLDMDNRWAVSITWQDPDGTYIAWDGFICNSGGTLTVTCNYVAGVLPPDFNWQTLNCADYPVTATAGSNCDCYTDCGSGNGGNGE